VKSTTSSGMDVTPVSFRPSQSPLVAKPGSCSSNGLGAIFRRSHCFPSFAFTSRHPPAHPGPSLAFHSLRRVKSATSSGMDATPVSFGPSQSPLAAVLLRQAPPAIVTTPLPG